MKECGDCEFKGYSPQLCIVHAKHCRQHEGEERKPLPPSLRIGAKALAGVGVGMGAVILGSAAISLVGGAALIHALLVKLSAGAGLTGGGIGFYRGLTEAKEKTDCNK